MIRCAHLSCRVAQGIPPYRGFARPFLPYRWARLNTRAVSAWSGLSGPVWGRRTHTAPLAPPGGMDGGILPLPTDAPREIHRILPARGGIDVRNVAVATAGGNRAGPERHPPPPKSGILFGASLLEIPRACDMEAGAFFGALAKVFAPRNRNIADPYRPAVSARRQAPGRGPRLDCIRPLCTGGWRCANPIPMQLGGRLPNHARPHSASRGETRADVSPRI